MDGESSSIDESANLGCHPWMEKCYPWMEKCHPWMKVSSVDVIHGLLFHLWMTSTDGDDGYRGSMIL